jgi:transcriptional regulator with PAS, ATPase and Fis domain
LKYRFPGNIRQLKNLVEQISVLSTENKEITTEILSRYLPKENNLPALYRGPNGEKDNISERDILYKVLFDMKKDVTDLKKIVLDLLNGQGQGGQLVKDNAHLFQDIHATTPELANESVVLNIPAASQPLSNGDHVEDVHDISHEAEDDSLSIEKKEKELIMRALRKNNNRRKYAARDLGISERTLYRKIKQYELEE